MTRAMGHFLRPHNFAKSFLFHGKINHLCLYAVLSLLYFNKFHPQYIPARVDAIMTSRRVNVTQISWTIKYFEDQVIWRLMNGKGMDDDGHLSRTQQNIERTEFASRSSALLVLLLLLRCGKYKYEYFKAINVFIFNNLWYCWMSLKR